MISGNEGNDTLLGGNDDDRIRGQAGDDLVFGGAGVDNIITGDGADFAFGGLGDDYIDGGDGNDVIYGNEGLDELLGGIGEDIIFGGSEDDSIHGNAGNDTLIGNEGQDTILGYDGDDLVFGAQGNDTIYGGDGNDQLYGQAGDDMIVGQNGDDLLVGQEGNDLLFGRSGNDLIWGGDGNDDLYGESGADILLGEAGNDGLTGGVDSTDDILFGGEGKDRYLISKGDFNDSDVDDARLIFRNGSNSWSNNEVRVIDQGLKLMHDRTENTRLLKDPITLEPLVFIKDLTIPAGPRIATNALVEVMENSTDPITGQLVTETRIERHLTFAEWNDADEALNAFYSAEIPREVAHSWAGQDAIPNVASELTAYWNQFLNISGWTQDRPDDILFFELSGDNMWWYQANAEFAQDYARTNPTADWTTAWRLYFQDDDASANDKLRMISKMNKIDQLFERLEIF